MKSMAKKMAPNWRSIERSIESYATMMKWRRAESSSCVKFDDRPLALGVHKLSLASQPVAVDAAAQVVTTSRRRRLVETITTL